MENVNTVDCEIEESLDYMDHYLEEIQKECLLSESNKILEKVNTKFPKLFKFETLYQQERNNYSKAYFSGSVFYKGNSIVDYIVDKNVNVFSLLGILTAFGKFN